MKIDILWLLTLQVISCYSNEPDCRREPKCEITRVHKMRTANCFDRQFKTFPKCLATDVEVIDLTYNRIRKVSRNDLRKFKYLKYLYLADNLIFNLDGDIFDDLTGLTTLDLSINAIPKLLPSIFQLPSLKSLYLSQNLNINIVDALDVNRPIPSPLTQLDISQTTDEENYSDFPNFGFLPFLAVLNITGNFYFEITPTLFMGFCNLQKLINDNVTTAFTDPCDCWILNNWFLKRNVKFTLFSCTILESNCPEKSLKEKDLLIYNECLKSYEAIQRTNIIIKSVIGIGIGLLIIILLIGLFWYWRRRNKKNQQVQQTIKKTTINDLSPLNVQKRSVPNEYIM